MTMSSDDPYAGRSPEDLGFYRIRPPLKPVTLGELAALDQTDSAA